MVAWVSFTEAAGVGLRPLIELAVAKEL